VEADPQVIAFPVAPDASPMVAIDPATPPVLCLHFQIEYSVRQRTVRCRQCNRLVDAFDWLVGYAERETRRLAFEREARERKQAAAERHAARRRAKAAAEQLAAGPALSVEEGRRRLAAMREQLG
jgi:hypothetical protein